MKPEEKRKLAEDLFYKMDNEGPIYYFTMYGPDFSKFEKLGFDVDEIKKAIKGAKYLDDIFSEIEELSCED